MKKNWYSVLLFLIGCVLVVYAMSLLSPMAGWLTLGVLFAAIGVAAYRPER